MRGWRAGQAPQPTSPVAGEPFLALAPSLPIARPSGVRWSRLEGGSPQRRAAASTHQGAARHRASMDDRAMRYRIPFAALGVLFFGCATATQIYGGDGEPAILIECGGRLRRISTCFDKAESVCEGKGYYLLERKEENIGQTARVTQHGGSSDPIIVRSIIVRCR